MAFKKNIPIKKEQQIFYCILPDPVRRRVFPLMIETIRRSEVFRGSSCTYSGSVRLSMERVLDGVIQYQDENTSFNVHAGEIYLVIPGKEQFWRCESDRAVKEWVAVSGFLLPQLLEKLSLCHTGALHPADLQQWNLLVTEAKELLVLPTPQNLRRLSGIAMELVLELAAVRTAPAVSPTLPLPLQRALTFLQLHRAEPADMAGLTSEAGVSTSTLLRLFRDFLDTTPCRYHTGLRMEEAAAILKREVISVKQLAERLHFSSPQYLTREFKRHFGVTPIRYRKG